jgi:hypothetical protein
MIPQPVEELFGGQGCQFVNTDLVDVNHPTPDGPPKHAQQADPVEAHDVSDHVPYRPALTQRRRLPLRGRQRLQKISEVGALGSGHLETIHGITS